MPRAIWKGSINFGLVQIPVGLYAAEQAQNLHFNLLDRRNKALVGYERVNKQTGESVPWEEIVRGYEYDNGQYVILTDEDFRRANVKATQTVEIVDFVDADKVSPMYFDKPYYLAPVKRGGAKAYALLRETLRRTGKVGIAKVVIRKRQHLAAVLVEGDALVLDLLRFHHELRDAGELDLPEQSLDELGVTDKELRMAEQLVEGMSEPWQPEKHQDDYREDVLALIDERVKAGQLEGVAEAPEEAAAEPGAEIVDLLSLLKRSIEQTPAGKAAAERRPKRVEKSTKSKARKGKSGGQARAT